MYEKTFGLSHAALAISVAMWASVAMADPNVKIISPADGVTVGAGESLDVIYDIVPNPGGDHLHIYVNNKEAGILRKQKGKYTLDPLPAGTNTVCLKVVNKGHASIGQETCIKVIRQ